MSIEQRKCDITPYESVELFIADCKTRGLATPTIRYYSTFLGYFNKYLEEKNYNEITHVVIAKYTNHLQKSGISTVSVNTHLRAVRTFVNWSIEEDYMQYIKVKMIKATEAVKEIYCENDISMLIDKPDTKCAFVDYRNYIAICMLIDTGVRLNSLINIKVSDVDFVNGMITVRITKNKKMLYIPLSATLNKILQKYFRAWSLSHNDYIVCETSRRQITGYGLYHALQKYCEAKGVDYHGIHSFRHSFARQWIVNGGDVFRLQTILGHSTLDMTRHYVQLYGTDLQKDYDQYTTLSKFNTEKVIRRKIRP